MNLALLTVLAAGGIPESGVYVPELLVFDQTMKNYMSANDIPGGVLAVMRDDVVVYNRGFGTYATDGSGPALPENAPMRIASIEKPITAAAIRRLEAAGELEFTDHVFDLAIYGQTNPGILQYLPYDGLLGDNRLMDITVQHLLDHQGGWDRTTAPHPCNPTATDFDPMFGAICIANQMGTTSPPGQVGTVQFMLSEPLQFDPGNCPQGWWGACYSNFGYLLLGMIVEQVSQMPYHDYIRQEVLTADMWVSGTEIFMGRTFASGSAGMHPSGCCQSSREPEYWSPGNATNVFGGSGSVPSPYGGWHQESFLGHGNSVATASTLLELASTYNLWGWDIGAEHAGTAGGSHGGSLDGTSTVLVQRSDGINIAVLFNKRCDTMCMGVHYATDLAELIRNLISVGAVPVWPTARVDGFWVDFGEILSGTGGYDDPFANLGDALAATGAGARLRLEPGQTNWTGVIAEKTLIDAPHGVAVIGSGN